MMTAGRRRRMTTVVIALTAFAAFMHLIAYPIVKGYAAVGLAPDKTALVVMTGMLALSWSLMASQAMELVTRAFYSRSDLDLILSSPASAQRLFAVRIATMTLATALMSLLAGVAVHQRPGGAWRPAVARRLRGRAGGQPHRHGVRAGAYHRVVHDAGAEADAAGRAGHGRRHRRRFRDRTAARRDRVARQPVPAPKFSRRPRWSRSRRRATACCTGRHARPLGDLTALAGVVAFSVLLLGASTALFAPRFGDCALAAGGVSRTATRRLATSNGFRRSTPGRALRMKEWLLLRRDPWLVSQSLMQILYLVPPAFLLWRGWGEGSGAVVVLVPVLVMAAGQLAGGSHGSRFRARTRPNWSRRHRFPPGKSSAPRSRRSWAPSASSSCRSWRRSRCCRCGTPR